MKKTHTGCNNNADSLKEEERNCKNTVYPGNALLKASFCFRCQISYLTVSKLTTENISLARSHQSGKKMMFYLILPPGAVSTSCSPSQHFQGPLSKYNFAVGGVQQPLCFRVVKLADSERISVGHVKWLHWQVTGYIFKAQRGAVDPAEM